MSYSSIKSRKYQAGLTLLELTVVLLILIGLSGLILPYAQGYLQRTHDSTGNDNLWELNNAINLFQAKYLEYPDGFHTLIDSSGNVYSDLMNPALVESSTAGAIGQMSLTMAGIDKVWTMKDGASNGSATFDAVNALVSVTKSTALAVVTKGGFSTATRHLAYAFYNNSAKSTEFDTNCYKYVAFGVGPESEMVGKVMSDAPLHFAATGGMGPEEKYNRFVAVFKVDKSNNTTLGCSDHTEPAKLVGSAMLMMPNHLFGLAHTQAHTWENIGNKDN
jgi:type II secretory pathway pseudopilin PulG